MESTVGSGKIVTIPLITEDGQPIPDSSSNDVLHQSSIAIEGSQNFEQNIEKASPDKKVIQWKLSLHQIGNTHLIVPYHVFVKVRNVQKHLFVVSCA